MLVPLRCPESGEALVVEGRLRGGRLQGGLRSAETGVSWPAADGFIKLYREGGVRPKDRLLRRFYDGLPRLHDPAVQVLLPLLQGKGAAATRSEYWPLLELEAATGPLRILEVGIGTGEELGGYAARLPAGLPVELWGVDLSVGMLRLCRRRPAPRPEVQVNLLLADAHALPFADMTFDRVLHVGATGSFGDPARALAEMARVARPGAPVVVVDEQLDPGRRHGLLRRAAFRAITFYERNPSCPSALLPPGVEDVLERQISRFYYALRFRRPISGTWPGWPAPPRPS